MRGPIERLFPNLSHRQRVAVDWLLTLVFAVLLVLGLKAWVVNPYKIPSASMEPTLHCAQPAADCEAGSSDRVLVNRFIYHFRDPRRGEMVVFDTPPLAQQECGSGGVYVKRVIGLPGETWEERDGVTYINGRALIEPWIRPGRRGHETKTLQVIERNDDIRRIPPDMYLMEGDNRAHSCDSRAWGLVPRKNIIGKVFFTYWPLGRISTH